jgi:hypothetical protein
VSGHALSLDAQPAAGPGFFERDRVLRRVQAAPEPGGAPRRPLDRPARLRRAARAARHPVVSLPNVAHWSTYAALARGTWPRDPEGIHDATHLRWFTLRDARELLAQAGLQPSVVERRPRLIWRGSRLDDLLGPAAVRVPGLRTLVTFQHVLAAYPARA